MDKDERNPGFDLTPVTRKETLPSDILRSYLEGEDEEVHLRDYLEVILRRKWIVIVFLISVVVTVTIASFLMQPVYQAKTTIHIQKEEPKVLTFEGVYTIDYWKMEDYYQTKYKILKSRRLAKRVIKRLNLDREPEFSFQDRTVSTADASRVNGPVRSPGERESALIDMFLGRVEVSPVKKSQLVEVKFVSHDPELAAKVANTIADEYIELTLDSKLEATNQAKRWLEKQIEDLRAKLETSEERLNSYVSSSRIIFLDKEKDFQSLQTQKLAELSTELGKATAERISKEALYREIKESGVNNSAILDNPLINSLRSEYASLESEYFKLSKLYKPEYPKMQRLMEQMEKLRSRIEVEAQKVVKAIEADYKAAVKKENYLSAAIEKLSKEVSDFQEKMIQYQILKREVDTNRQLYNNLLQRLKEVGVSASISASNIQIIDRAEVPRAPYKPKKAVNIALSLIVGLFGGVFLAFFVEYFDNTIKTVNEIEKKSRLPVLGMVPAAEDAEGNLICVNSGENGAMAEAFRSISTYLQFSSASKPPKRILFTSPLAEEGKTTLAVNTAMSLIGYFGKGVIVDADLRKPDIHNFMGLDNKTGLSSFLSGNIEFDSLIKGSPYEGLDVITSGPIPPNPSELLSSTRMKELVDGLFALYDFVILDSPPVLGMADSPILSTVVEGVIVVVKAGATPSDALVQTKKVLYSVNGKILGVVLNEIDTKSRYGYYSYYYYSYYGDRKKTREREVA